MNLHTPKPIRVVPWALAGFLVIAAGCGTTQVHRIAGADGSTDAYDILFLGAGFETDDELEAYRAAAGALAAALMETDPYSRYADRLRFWRIDNRSGPIGTSTCPVGALSTASTCGHKTLPAPPPSPAPAPIETLDPDGAAVVEKDLEVSLCWTDSAATGSCRVLWASPDGQTRAAELAALAPDIDAVVILANTQLWAGAGSQDGLSAGLSLAVVGVPIDGGSGAAEGVNLIAHELAHALGLADEYSDAIGSSSVSAAGFGNVWQPPDPCYVPDTTDPVKPAGDALRIPWVDFLDCGVSLDPKLDCDYTAADAACPRVWNPYHSTASCSELRTTIPATCLDYPGLIEGAFYSKEGIYRAMYACRMNATADPFCVVCAAWIEAFFVCNYVKPGSC